jgi:peptide/nickel transport system substrate-binding protein
MGAGGWPTWLINQDYVPDAEIREVLRDKRFRKAISHAMNRRRIIDVVWEGVGQVQQGTISSQAWHFRSDEGRKIFEQWNNADIEYDTSLANDLLDDIGMLDRDTDGFRELPGGKPFELVMDLGDWGGIQISTEATEVYRGNLKDVGIRAVVNNLVKQPGWELRQREGTYMMRNTVTCELDIWTFPDWLFPARSNRCWPMAGRWRETGGVEGWKPGENSPAARLLALLDKGLFEPDIDRRHEIVWEAIRIHIEDGPFFVAASGDQIIPVVVKNTFHNVPPTGILGPWAPASPGNKHPEQFWIE